MGRFVAGTLPFRDTIGGAFRNRARIVLAKARAREDTRDDSNRGID
jgi:hypothetical protein